MYILFGKVLNNTRLSAMIFNIIMAALAAQELSFFMKRSKKYFWGGDYTRYFIEVFDYIQMDRFLTNENSKFINILVVTIFIALFSIFWWVIYCLSKKIQPSKMSANLCYMPRN